MYKNLIRWVMSVVFVWAGISAVSFAQITVTANDAPSAPGIYFEMSFNDTVDVNLGQPGANQVWDFSSTLLPQKAYWRVIDANTSPFSHRFPTANIVYKVTEDNSSSITYNYVRLTDANLTELGRGTLQVSGTDTTVTELLVSKRATPKLNLPAKYGDPEWSSVLVVDTSLGIFKATIVDSSYNRIDAWGTIKTTFGEFPCLRIRQDHSQYAYTSFIALPLEINVNYFWVTNNYGILATITGMSDLTNPNPNPNYSKAKSINIMTNFLTAINEFAGGEIPIKFELFQNYPNPFNPTTAISYQLNQPSEVVLKVFNIAGQEVALLFQARQPAGKYQFKWNASNLPSGIYYYQIQANDNLMTRKCLLLR